MTNGTCVITFASWEERFTLGFDRDLERGDVSTAVMFYFDYYSAWTDQNRQAVENVCRQRGITLLPHLLQRNQPAANWRIVCQVVRNNIPRAAKVMIDLSTMPREIIWNILWLLQIAEVDIRYCYHCPGEYTDDWLSRDPGAPRLVYKLSGLPSFTSRTALLVTAGYDPQRVKQLITWYEPEKVAVGLQSESRFRHNEQRMANYRDVFSKEHECSFFELDSYAEDHGQEAIQRIVTSWRGSHNIVMSSLGPKLTAISLYCVQRANPETALTYAPSNQFNRDYSRGIGDSIWGTLSAAAGTQ